VYLIDIIQFPVKNSPLDISSLQVDYAEKGLSLRQIAAQKIHSRQVISDVLKANGVHLRAPRQIHENPSRLKFGYRKKAGKVVPHMGEQQVIQAIKDLKGEGMTLRGIAQRMTALRIPSKNGKPKWHPMMVKRILDAFKNEIAVKI
jgi:hypothetical protein